jgi:hypothetical protein
MNKGITSINLFPTQQKLTPKGDKHEVQDNMNSYFSNTFLPNMAEIYGDNFVMEIGRDEFAKLMEKHSYKTGSKLMVRFVKDCVRLTDAIDNGNLDTEIEKAEQLSNNLNARVEALKKLKEDNPNDDDDTDDDTDDNTGE